MVRRCRNPKDKDYPYYGGRGIEVCSFIAAGPVNLVHSIGLKPKGKSLDRINNNDGYKCGKCEQCLAYGWKKNIRWATPKEQVRNRSNTLFIQKDGVVRCAQEWAEIIPNLTLRTIRERLKRGITGDALLEPVHQAPLVTVHNQSRTILQWSKITGLDPRTIESRKRRGVTGQDLIAPLQRAARRLPKP